MQEDNEVIFDTHKQVKKFMSVGLTEAQAEAQVEVFIQFIDGNLATKRSLLEVEASLKKDLKEVEAGLKKDIKEIDLKIDIVEANLKRDINEVEANLKRDLKQLEVNLNKEITIKMGIMATVTISVLTAVMKLIN